jgi:hypothetical protein
MLCFLCEKLFFTRSNTFYHHFCNECIEDALECFNNIDPHVYYHKEKSLVKRDCDQIYNEGRSCLHLQKTTEDVEK